MANNWNIPLWLEEEVLERDKTCVYCGVEFTSPKVSMKTAGSWEHIINDITIITPENIVRCCCSCNASKGQKRLSEWLASDFCKKKGITAETLSPVVQAAIANGE